MHLYEVRIYIDDCLKSFKVYDNSAQEAAATIARVYNRPIDSVEEITSTNLW